MTHGRALWKASQVFAPSFPRQSSDDGTIQSQRNSRTHFVDALTRATNNRMPGYYSVYSFPRGHSTNGNIPAVDCIFIDLDMPKDSEYRSGEKTFGAWKRSMSKLLARARMIATSILERGCADYFRVVLSGHKGLHLYLDFPEIHPANGRFGQFKGGLRSYGNRVMDWLDQIAGGINIDPWVDVDAHDLGRLARHPNTRHHGAEYDDEERWCVPITVDELADLHWEDYLEYTSEPRWPDIERTPWADVGDRVIQHIRTASSESSRSGGGSSYNSTAVEYYTGELDDDDVDGDQFAIEPAKSEIEFEDLPVIISNKPCVWHFRERDDAYDHGDASRAMEINIMALLIEKRVPLEVIHEFFSTIPGYDRGYTQELLEDIIAREYKAFKCENICGTHQGPGRAPQFCLGDIGDTPSPDEGCGIYQRADDLQK